ncbi:TauD/TfdA family dioxygenase [Streptomyces sp. ISL-11]|uniref:TauD/TfdA family dioxygenase n=1 Tax=Streptomyces sp. ISL-11 TaxID=2819174 RepID=UPI001BEAAA6A|nr:TauD/TfdA family dioxygenase [Streptomyces sp. ISL-11]MBT2383373.1 TauD/TfdA family dioxygenase [Streptomyces sp. ISL-11]
MTGGIRLSQYRLDDGTRDVLGKEISARVAATELDSDADEAILATIGAHALGNLLPGQVLHELEIFSVAGAHALLLGNLPRQDFPPTPVHGYGDETALAATNALHFGLLQLLGRTPFAVSYENDGRLVRNVVPNPAASGITSSWGADSEFFWHSDQPHLPFGEPGTDPRLYVPHYLSFYAVRNAERVPTELTSVDGIADALDESTLRLLERPEYAVGVPASNDADAPVRQLENARLLETGPDGRRRARYDQGTTRGLTEDAAAALASYGDFLAEVPTADLMLTPGDFMIFDNCRVLHRRRAFTPRPDAEARWLRRVYAS